MSGSADTFFIKLYPRHMDTLLTSSSPFELRPGDVVLYLKYSTLHYSLHSPGTAVVPLSCRCRVCPVAPGTAAPRGRARVRISTLHRDVHVRHEIAWSYFGINI